MPPPPYDTHLTPSTPSALPLAVPGFRLPAQPTVRAYLGASGQAGVGVDLQQAGGWGFYLGAMVRPVGYASSAGSLAGGGGWGSDSGVSRSPGPLQFSRGASPSTPGGSRGRRVGGTPSSVSLSEFGSPPPPPTPLPDESTVLVADGGRDFFWQPRFGFGIYFGDR